MFLKIRKKFKLKDYNESQQAVIVEGSSIINTHESKLYFLQGPPGTGKSHTIVGIVNAMFFVSQKSTNKFFPLFFLFRAY